MIAVNRSKRIAQSVDRLPLSIPAQNWIVLGFARQTIESTIS